MSKRFVRSLIATALLYAHDASAVVLVSPADMTGSRTTPVASGIETSGRWADTSKGFRVDWKILFDGQYWNYEYNLRAKDGSSLSPGLSHWIIEVSRIITSSNVSSYIFDKNFPIQGPRMWPRDPDSPNTKSPGANRGNPNLPADVYGIGSSSRLACV